MNITKSKLKQIIKEEISALLKEAELPADIEQAARAEPTKQKTTKAQQSPAAAPEKEVTTKATSAKRAQIVMDKVLKLRPKIFQALAKDPKAASQFVSYIANKLNVDLTATTAQSAVKTQAKRIGVGKT